MLNPTPSEPTKSLLTPGEFAITTNEFWETQWSERGARTFLTDLLHRRSYGPNGFHARLFRRVAPGVFDGAKIIELGGASSRLLVDFAKNNNAQVTAVDYSDTGVAQTKELFQREGLNGEVLHEDIFKWAAGGVDRSFDVVTHWGLLEHFADPEPIMKISANLVRPGGKVVFTMPNLGAKGVSLWRRYSPENLKAHVYHDDQAIAASARAAGLVLEKKFHCGAPMVRMAPLEKRSIGAFIVNIVHTGLTLAGAVFPSLYTRGIADVSNTRGFVLRKP